jgi:hypothetical protein
LLTLLPKRPDMQMTGSVEWQFHHGAFAFSSPPLGYHPPSFRKPVKLDQWKFAEFTLSDEDITAEKGFRYALEDHERKSAEMLDGELGKRYGMEWVEG